MYSGALNRVDPDTMQVDHRDRLDVNPRNHHGLG